MVCTYPVVYRSVVRTVLLCSVFEAEQVVEKKSYAVSNDRTILVSGLEPGKTYITSLVAGDGISSETRSDPQMVATLGKGKL